MEFDKQSAATLDHVSPVKRLLLLLSRVGVAGLINTAVGFGVITALDVGLHVESHLANAAGYAVGILVSFFLSKGYVFRSKAPGAAVRFFVAVAIAFTVNQLALTLARSIVGASPIERAGAQLFGMMTFTATQFLFSYFWVFRDRK